MTSRRDFMKFCGAGGLAMLAGRLPWAIAQQQQRPNIVFILVDDLGWMDLGYQGSRFYQTPNIDRFAQMAVRFTDAYASCPVCSPTRASILTGKYPARLGLTDILRNRKGPAGRLLPPENLQGLPHEEITLAEALREHGYRTFLAGKWHLGAEGSLPEDHGFEINKGGFHAGYPLGGYYSPYENPKLEDGPEGEYLTDRLTDESIRFMEQNRDNPFFLMLSFYTVHSPIEACDRLIDENRRRAAELELEGPASIPEHAGHTKMHQDNPEYASMVQAMDKNVGRLLRRLDELGLTDNTLVILTSDNGGLSTKKTVDTVPTSNLPLRAGKGWCYEGGIRVPLLIRPPGGAGGGRQSNVPVTSTDFYPTILDVAGLPQLPEQHVDGVSLAGVLRGGKAPDRQAIYWHFPHYPLTKWTPGGAIRAGDWKLIEFYEEQKIELYNLAEDIGERNELSQSHPQKAAELKQMLERWREDVNAAMPVPNPDYAGD